MTSARPNTPINSDDELPTVTKEPVYISDAVNGYVEVQNSNMWWDIQDDDNNNEYGDFLEDYSDVDLAYFADTDEPSNVINEEQVDLLCYQVKEGMSLGSAKEYMGEVSQATLEAARLRLAQENHKDVVINIPQQGITTQNPTDAQQQTPFASLLSTFGFSNRNEKRESKEKEENSNNPSVTSKKL